jgi:hypothetical protein
MQKQQLEQGYLDGHMNKDLNKRDLWEDAEQDGLTKNWDTPR